MYKVLITTSGTGSRLKELTKKQNKALITINNKTVISYIIEAYPKKTPLVITIGYFGEQVKKFVQDKYNDRDISFVTIDNYDGPGSSLGYSMLQAKTKLQCPFIFHCNDTIVLNQAVPSPEKFNWNGGATGNDPTIFNTVHYSSFTVEHGNMKLMQPKGAKEYDFFHIGLVGFKNYKVFWEELQKAYDANPNDSTLNDVVAIKKMIKQGYTFKSVEFKDWYDTGNLNGFANAEEMITKH
jgi:NDP-sugar pyrophosphorylase family protein